MYTSVIFWSLMSQQIGFICKALTALHCIVYTQMLRSWCKHIVVPDKTHNILQSVPNFTWLTVTISWVQNIFISPYCKHLHDLNPPNQWPTVHRVNFKFHKSATEICGRISNRNSRLPCPQGWHIIRARVSIPQTR